MAASGRREALNLPRQLTGSPETAASNGIERRLARWIVGLFDSARIELVLWDGASAASRPGERALARVHVRSRAALHRLLRNPKLNFGDLYALGLVEVEGDLVHLLEHACYALDEPRGALTRLLWRDVRPRSTSRRAARENIHHHYDLGNAFYRLWLDREAMQYTCAYYPHDGMTLEAAQLAKMEHVCRKLRLAPGQRVVEAGCGWGGLALYMARTRGVKVRAFNISHEQIVHAREWAAREGLASQVEFVEDDYRNVSGRYDAFVSIGMLEHVGRSHYTDLGNVIERSLEPHGVGLLHSIGRNRPAYMNGWIERRIFPGAYPPSLREMLEVLEPHRFSVLDVENLRLHYARTLEHWLERFRAAEDEVTAMYDEPFTRAWRLYLAGSIAAFRAGSLQLFQVLFTRERNNALPPSRAHLYQ